MIGMRMRHSIKLHWNGKWYESSKNAWFIIGIKIGMENWDT